jgi:flagellin
MGLRINTNIASQEVQKNLKASGAQQEAEFSKLSSGKRINKASDDAAGLAISTKMEAENRGLKVATRNANDGISLVQVAEGGLNETSNILTRLRELSVQAASDTIGDSDRGYLNLEYNQLVQEADRISQTTSYNGKPLLSGQGTALQIQVGVHSDANNMIEVDPSAMDASAESLGIGGSGIQSKSDALSNLNKLDGAINKVSAFRANFGSIQSRLQSSVNNLETASVNGAESLSRIQDVDVAESSAKLASAQIKTAAGTAALAQANQLGSNALRLVG